MPRQACPSSHLDPVLVLKPPSGRLFACPSGTEAIGMALVASSKFRVYSVRNFSKRFKCFRLLTSFLKTWFGGWNSGERTKNVETSGEEVLWGVLGVGGSCLFEWLCICHWLPESSLPPDLLILKVITKQRVLWSSWARSFSSEVCSRISHRPFSALRQD